LNAVDVLCAQNGFEKSRIGLSALIRSMLQKDYVAIARYVKRQNSEPFLACLYPFVSEDTECMYVCQLPFDEDVREFPFPAFARNPKYEVTPAQKKSARELIEKFSLDSLYEPPFACLTCQVILCPQRQLQIPGCKGIILALKVEL
jgi:ATP-dependent DNA helicase 2 subunit 2